MDVADLEVLRLILRGGSVIDWRRLHFRDAAEVDRFLHLHLFDLEDPRDEGRLRAVLAQAVEYLRSAFGYRVAAAVAAPEDLRTSSCSRAAWPSPPATAASPAWCSR